MTELNQIKALAELNGWKHDEAMPPAWTSPSGDKYHCDYDDVQFFQPYLTSHDAIAPLIEKLDRSTAIIFMLRLSEVVSGNQFRQSPSAAAFGMMHVWTMLTAETKQLAEALLRAKGLWTE